MFKPVKDMRGNEENLSLWDRFKSGSWLKKETDSFEDKKPRRRRKKRSLDRPSRTPSRTLVHEVPREKNVKLHQKSDLVDWEPIAPTERAALALDRQGSSTNLDNRASLNTNQGYNDDVKAYEGDVTTDMFGLPPKSIPPPWNIDPSPVEHSEIEKSVQAQNSHPFRPSAKGRVPRRESSMESMTWLSIAGSSNETINQEDVLRQEQIAKIVHKSLEDIKNDCGWQGDHRVFGTGEKAPLVSLRPLGHGNQGVVDEVRINSGNHHSFVRKTVRILNFNRAQRLRTVKQEATALAKLVHEHIVKIIGSYEEGPSYKMHYSLLMYPVGDDDLKKFLEMLGEQQVHLHELSDDEIAERHGWLWNWFGCLSDALNYMHEMGIRHQDIKSSNIIHRGRDIFFTDFSSAGEFNIDFTTSTDSPACSTNTYRAPEASQFGERHGLGTDIFSLGCVFLEMLTVLSDTTLASFQEFCCTENASSSENSRIPIYRNSQNQIREWFSQHDKHQDIHMKIEPMLALKREDRPSSSEVLQSMLEVIDEKKPLVICNCHRERGMVESTKPEISTNQSGSIDQEDFDGCILCSSKLEDGECSQCQLFLDNGEFRPLYSQVSSQNSTTGNDRSFPTGPEYIQDGPERIMEAWPNLKPIWDRTASGKKAKRRRRSTVANMGVARPNRQNFGSDGNDYQMYEGSEKRT